MQFGLGVSTPTLQTIDSHFKIGSFSFTLKYRAICIAFLFFLLIAPNKKLLWNTIKWLQFLSSVPLICTLICIIENFMQNWTQIGTSVFNFYWNIVIPQFKAMTFLHWCKNEENIKQSDSFCRLSSHRTTFFKTFKWTSADYCKIYLTAICFSNESIKIKHHL